MTYCNKLLKSAEETGSIACMGLDPVVEAMHSSLPPSPRFKIEKFFELLFKEMDEQKVLPGAFKPNQGFYIKHDKPLDGKFPGSLALSKVLNMLRDVFPEIPVILDNKRGDIGKSSANYAVEGFDCWGADAVTVSPYMGTDSVMPFVDKGSGVYILTRTSNPGAMDFQNTNIGAISTNFRLYHAVANKIVEWAQGKPGVGAVIGATSPEELSDLVKLYAKEDIPLLIPGVGGQGGNAEEVMSRLRDANYDLALVRINSSSGLTHPWAKKKKPAPDDYTKVCVEALHKLNEAIGYKYKA